jgi:hypothetical protein
MDTVFGGMRAPATLGSFLRAFIWENVRQLRQVHGPEEKLLFKGLNALISVISTPLAAAQSGLRGGSAGSARGAAGLVGGLEADLRGRLACGVTAGACRAESRGGRMPRSSSCAIAPTPVRYSSVAPVNGG